VRGVADKPDFTTRMPTFGVAKGWDADILAHALDQCEAAGLIEETLYDNRMPIVGLRDADLVRSLFRGELRFRIRL
jgi:ATP-dependent DNA helicase RecQ